ncbi:MAG TPA: dTMP kinase [Verrucomicrobiota bacterium]|nr:dTMP kinase [Verrucomicrobiota bacterium]HRR63751.1 dTMP kinase [Candidatus Paceibacterota bacterium]MDI9373227.1 dTMP kinase [Verrucomicrobiota bacterium]NLH85126.1 dTMP kinase [Verrucomicrobiota bacterium]HNR72233.1 dTMP kinase [Verrucomicrobiota bacterium]
MPGRLITFEGTEGSGKTTQISLLAERLRAQGHPVRTLREPGGTAIGEEIRHTLKHSPANHAMTPEAELLLMNASRAQLVREVIRPALAAGQIVLCDRYYDSTIAYQGYGRQLDLRMVQSLIEVAVGGTRPDLTLVFVVPQEVSEARRRVRQPTLPLSLKRDRFEEADRAFFDRVAQGYQALAAAEPGRVRLLDATGKVADIQAAIWDLVQPLLPGKGRPAG